MLGLNWSQVSLCEASASEWIVCEIMIVYDNWKNERKGEEVGSDYGNEPSSR